MVVINVIHPIFQAHGRIVLSGPLVVGWGQVTCFGQ